MSKSTLIPEIERWIALHPLQGKPSILKTLHPDLDDPEFYYQLRVEGMRFGQFGIYLDEGGLFQVVHPNTGRLCGMPFSSENDARRMISCLKGLTDWRKVDWKDHVRFSKTILYRVCIEASNYCHGVLECKRLLEMVKHELSKQETVIVEESIEDAEPVAFGSGERGTVKPRVNVVVNSDGGWGTIIT